MKRIFAMAVIFGMALMAGCRVSGDKHGDKGVRISTPFGGMQVKTDDTTVLQNIGLPQYPGATLVKKDNDKGAADVNMNFGKFHLKVNAASYHSDDSPDMVLAFYRKALEKYGDVIQCKNNQPVGTPTRTSEGLTCDDNGGGHISVSDSESGKSQLKSGSKRYQHIVEISPDGSGTKFGLVALDLPGDLGSHDKSTE